MFEPLSQNAMPESDTNTDGRCLRVGVLTNPRSGGNKNGCRGVRSVLAQWPDTIQREAITPEDIVKVLAEFSSLGVNLVIINGGDGTVQAALTAMGAEGLFPKLPLLALLHAGTTSMLPRDVGIAGSPAVALSRVLDWAQSPNDDFEIHSRYVLKVLRGASYPPLCGMFFGAGVICQGIRIFHSEDNPAGRRGQFMPAVTMLRLLFAILFKKHDMVPPFLAQATLDGQHKGKREDLFVLVSTLERLFLGMRPYWGQGDGPLRYTAVGSEPRYLLRVLLSLFRSRQSRHANAANGYFSYNVHDVRLDMEGEFTLDGELYKAGEGLVQIVPEGPFKFLCSRR